MTEHEEDLARGIPLRGTYERYVYELEKRWHSSAEHRSRQEMARLGGWSCDSSMNSAKHSVVNGGARTATLQKFCLVWPDLLWFLPPSPATKKAARPAELGMRTQRPNCDPLIEANRRAHEQTAAMLTSPPPKVVRFSPAFETSEIKEAFDRLRDLITSALAAQLG